MAEAILSDLATKILEGLGSLLVQEIGLASGVKKELRKLEYSLSTINAILLDAETKGAMNHEVKVWLRKLKDVAYDAENVLDEFATEGLRQKVELPNNIIVKQSEGILFESLRRLQLMALSVDTLKATEIGKAVNGLRKHNSKQIRHLTRTLIDGWKVMVDEWVNAAAAVAGATEGSPDSVNPSVVDEEEGLPSPPLDEGAIFFATQATSIELSQFFDGMDDDGNPRNNGEFNKNRENGRKTTMESHNIPKRKPPPPNEANLLTKDSKGQLARKPDTIIKQTKPSNTVSGPGRPLKQSSDPKANNEMKFQQKMNLTGIQRRPVAGQQDVSIKSKMSDDNSVGAKLEAAKRKLQEGYQQAENAKKQRTIQVMELHDLPKQGIGHRHTHLKPGNYNRHWANGRR